MQLLTEIITPKGVRVKPDEVRLTQSNCINFYDLYADRWRIGQIRLSIEPKAIYVMGMDNFTHHKPLSKRYHNVGRALHEIAFRESIRCGLDGRVELAARDSTSVLFHMNCGFFPCTRRAASGYVPEKDLITKDKIDKAIRDAKEARRKGLNAPFVREVVVEAWQMFLPPETIEKLRAIYFPQDEHKETNTPSQKPSAVLSPVVSDPIYQKIEQLVHLGKLAKYDAQDLTKNLLHPSHPGDQETWRQATSPAGLEAMNKEYLSGWVIKVHFSQTQSGKLKPMLSPWGLYAFSRFLIGWEDCMKNHEETLQFVLSDYGIQALEEGLIKPSDFYQKSPLQQDFTEALYNSLKWKEKSPSDLFTETPLPNPKMLLESR
ncbi:MAG TPA: hypothetical protein VGV92_03280 [Gammaproteobacteria bacterium]|nr:hypothetical protein [Gammaproteobacteria bacterium]